MLELKAGIFVGTLSALVREKLWTKICDKIKDGGAFLIHPMNNEQKFEILTHGNTQRTVIDLDGISLIRIPLTKRVTSRKGSRRKFIHDDQISVGTEAVLTSAEPKDLLSVSPGFSHPSQGIFPKNFVWRLLTISIKNDEAHFDYQGISSFPEIQHNDIWQDAWKGDLETICNSIMRVIQDPKIIENTPYFNKRVISLDIETTEYLPKAYEGFVNILGIAILDFTDNAQQESALIVHQIFNMTRKKDQAHYLLRLLKEEIQAADVCVLFNKNFDLKILEKIVKDENLSITIPNVIIDLNDKFRNLADLELSLAKQTGFHRHQTQKSKFPEYYKLFKGIGRDGRNKKLEPIGSYNLLDTLTPLLYHILNH